MWRVVAKANHYLGWPPQPARVPSKIVIVHHQIALGLLETDAEDVGTTTLTLVNFSSYLIADHDDLGKSRKRFF